MIDTLSSGLLLPGLTIPGIVPGLGAGGAGRGWQGRKERMLISWGWKWVGSSGPI